MNIIMDMKDMNNGIRAENKCVVKFINLLFQ